ncbi:glutathione hydrolase 3-like [Dioscorea cayenensis subsp. rotundata]|uniref:Glutathione hydrolase n=1 Tax=Dioscorea cayennensis subsp. rotundata TaxID=55577 RepID=A0AB40C8T4_DIOCR|nr:glutathione hydrolase 3-like [Dioscorea cayenensis subsp. rotundata]
MESSADLEATLLGDRSPERRTRATIAAVSLIVLGLGFILVFTVFQIDHNDGQIWRRDEPRLRLERKEEVESEVGVVAADDGRCSEIGVSMLKLGGHAVDAAVATALCLGVVHPMSSGIGGGAFMVVRSSDGGDAEAFDSRETAPAAASQNMYAKNPSSKIRGALSAGVPGEITGLHAAWLKYGKLTWKSLFQPSIKLARDGFTVTPYFESILKDSEDAIMADPGLRQVYAPKGKLLQATNTCYNSQLASTLEIIADEGPQVLYNGTIAEKLVEDVKNAGGIITMEDMRQYRVKITKAMETKALGFTVLGMPLPSSGTIGMTLILNILGSYGSSDALKGLLGLHRFIEALKHMLAIRMNLGDPDFVDATKYESLMLSSSFAEKIRHKILDNTTFDPSYYLDRWNQLDDHGTSHVSIVDAERNAVAMTSTVNYYFGAKVQSPSTGIVLNNEMNDFSVPGEPTPDELPPSPANFIEPGKRPLSSMTPVIILKDNQLAGVVGASGGIYIIPAVTQVFIKHYILGMEPLAAIQHPRVYHHLIPNVVTYENWTTVNGDHIEFMEKAKVFLEERGHQVKGMSGGGFSQLVVHNLTNPVDINKRKAAPLGKNSVFYGMLTAVSDPRKSGRPAGI